MKTKLGKLSWILILFMLVLPAFAQEKEEQEEKEETEEISDDLQAIVDATIAVWLSDINGDSNKAEEYGQLPDGFVLNNFSASVLMKNGRFLNMNGERVRLNNASYAFDYGVSGKYVLNIDYSKIPHIFSRNGLTIWTETAPGVWSLADNLQQTIQDLNNVDPSDPSYSSGLFAQRTYVSNFLDVSHDQALDLMRNRGNVGVQTAVGKDWNVDVNYFQENRDGTRPFGTTFGFSWVTEVPERLVYKTFDIHAGAEYNKDGKSMAFAYDLSLFENEIQSLIWDNPLRIDDRTYANAYSNGDGTSRGRMQLAPDNTANTFSFAGATKAGRGRLTGSFVYSLWTDSVDLLPFTINTAIEPIPLPASTFNGKQQIINATVRYTAPVGRKGDFTANYRLYDNNNDNDQFIIGQYVRVDQVIEPLERFDCNPATNTCVTIENPPTPLYAFSTNAIDLDFGYKLRKNVKWHAGYVFDHWSRDERDTDSTNTNRFKTGIDALLTEKLTLRFSYQYAQRRSDEFFVDNAVYLFAPLRRYDVANLNQNLVRAIADLILSEAASVDFNFTLANNNYPDSDYGISKWNHYSIGADFSYAFKDNSNFNFWYEYANTDRDQAARQSNSDGTPAQSPTRDWFVNLVDTYNTIGAGYRRNFKKDINWNINLTYAVGNGKADFVTGTALRPTGPANIPNVDDTELFTGKTGVDVKVAAHARIGVFYWYEKYTIDDFAENALQEDLIFIPVPGQPPPGSVGGTITLNERQPDYDFNSGWVGLIVTW